MRRKARLFAVALMAMALAGPVVGATPPITPDTLRAFELSNAFSSREALLEQFLQALHAKDAAALRRLRVTEDEYRTFFIPASVKEGAPPQLPSERASKLYWDLLNTKSLYSADAMLRGFGGRSYKLKGVAYEKGPRTYAFYSADRGTLLTVEDDAGKSLEISLGSIVDVKGQFKFMSFISGD